MGGTSMSSATQAGKCPSALIKNWHSLIQKKWPSGTHSAQAAVPNGYWARVRNELKLHMLSQLSVWMTKVACPHWWPSLAALGQRGMTHFILVAVCLSLQQNKTSRVSQLRIFVSVIASDVKDTIKDEHYTIPRGRHSRANRCWLLLFRVFL